MFWGNPSSILNTIFSNLRFFIPFTKRLGYIGWLGHGNLGDEGMYVAFKKLFSGYNVLPFKHSEKIIYFENLLKQKAFNAVCLGGGTFINADAIKQFKIAQENYSPTFVFGAGAMDPALWGTVEHRPTVFSKASEWIECLNKCHYVGVRGPLSKQILEDNGFNKAEIIGDLILSLSSDAIVRKQRKKKLGINIGVAGGYMWGSEEGVLDFIVELAKIMLEKKWQITFYPVISSDINYIKKAVRRIGGFTAIFDEYRSIAKTMHSLQGCDLFIGEKLHSTALAMCAHTPSIMLEYKPKCLDFMLSMEMEKFNIRTDRLSVNMAIDLAEELYSNLEKYQNKIAQKANQYRQLQKEKADVLSKIICQK